ncbi:hypothetical protein [Propionivibrio sp.]|uniref:hypothetical protein n=1 Tax=Propionivibrio sp. TaxID=2212460 RepID=UPI003BF37305
MPVLKKCKLFPIIGLLGLLVTNAHAESPPFESCEQIRELIRAQTGLLPKSDTALLQKLGVRQECGFTAAEVYRAAYGDRPIPQGEGRDRHSKHQDDDDCDAGGTPREKSSFQIK